MTSTLKMGVGGQHHAPAALPPEENRYPLYSRLGGPHGRSGRVRKISSPPGFDPRTVQPVASRYTDWAILAHASNSTDLNTLSYGKHGIITKTTHLAFTAPVRNTMRHHTETIVEKMRMTQNTLTFESCIWHWVKSVQCLFSAIKKNEFRV